MARYKGYIKGQKGEVSRLGSANSGMSTTINGWNVGIHVEARIIDGEDVFFIYKTGGSNKSSSIEMIAEVNTNQAKLKDVLKVYNHV